MEPINPNEENETLDTTAVPKGKARIAGMSTENNAADLEAPPDIVVEN